MSSIGGAETWATAKTLEMRLDVNEMRMLRWIRNEHVRGSAKVAPATKKITEKMLKWYGYAKRRERAKNGIGPIGTSIRKEERAERKPDNQVERLL